MYRDFVAPGILQREIEVVKTQESLKPSAAQMSLASLSNVVASTFSGRTTLSSLNSSVYLGKERRASENGNVSYKSPAAEESIGGAHEVISGLLSK